MNTARDYANNVDLKLAGWRVIRIWECEIKTKAKREETLSRLFAMIAGIPSDLLSLPDESNEPVAAELFIPYGIVTPHPSKR